MTENMRGILVREKLQRYHLSHEHFRRVLLGRRLHKRLKHLPGEPGLSSTPLYIMLASSRSRETPARGVGTSIVSFEFESSSRTGVFGSPVPVVALSKASGRTSKGFDETRRQQAVKR